MIRTLFFEEIHQTGDQGPKANNGFSRHQLVLITAQEILIVFEEGFDLPTDGEHIYQFLRAHIEQGAAPITDRIQRLLQIVAGDPPAVKNAVVVIDTSKGKIKVELNGEKAPITVQNFLQYVEDKFYDGTLFHRVMPNFMIQGGGFEPGMSEKKTRETIKNEWANGLKNERGAIAMARLPALDSATAQFFINVVDNPALDQGKYAVFGKVIEGMDVVDAIKVVPTANRGGHEAVPTEDVIIRSIRLEK